MGFIELEAIGEGERKSEVVKKKKVVFLLLAILTSSLYLCIFSCPLTCTLPMRRAWHVPLACFLNHFFTC